jgi:hypothetical protein
MNFNYKKWIEKDLWTDIESAELLASHHTEFINTEDDILNKLHESLYKSDVITYIEKITRAAHIGILKSEYQDKEETYFFKPLILLEWAFNIQIQIPKHLLSWYLDEKTGFQLCFFFEKQMTGHIKELRKKLESKPEMKHRSELIDVMNAAISEFWENHNPENPPKNSDIEEWILENFKDNGLVNQSIVKAMCTIMRPEKYKAPASKTGKK